MNVPALIIASLTPAGWLVMIVSISAVLVGTAWCFYRILTLPPVEAETTMHGQPAIDTRDTEQSY